MALDLRLEISGFGYLALDLWRAIFGSRSFALDLWLGELAPGPGGTVGRELGELGKATGNYHTLKDRVRAVSVNLARERVNHLVGQIIHPDAKYLGSTNSLVGPH